MNNPPIHRFQAAELAEHTARIALLEEAKKRKEDEAMTWQHRVSPLRHEPCHLKIFITFFTPDEFAFLQICPKAVCISIVVVHS